MTPHTVVLFGGYSVAVAIVAAGVYQIIRWRMAAVIRTARAGRAAVAARATAWAALMWWGLDTWIEWPDPQWWQQPIHGGAGWYYAGLIVVLAEERIVTAVLAVVAGAAVVFAWLTKWEQRRDVTDRPVTE